METKKIFIGNLDFGATEDELKTLLSMYGTIASIKFHQKKGYAFAEMGNAEEASKAVQGLNGQKHRDREIRASLEMKASKAKALSIKKYKERGWNFAKEKAARTPDTQVPGEEYQDFRESGSKDRERPPRSPYGKKGDYRSKAKSSDYPLKGKMPTRSDKQLSSDYTAPRKKTGFGHKPSYSPKPKRTGERDHQDRAPRAESDFRSSERSRSPRPDKREWTPKKPSYSGKPARDGERSSSFRVPKKEWSSEKTWGASKPASRNWKDKPGEKENSGDKPYSKPWSAKGPQKRFFKSPAPKSGGSGGTWKKSSSGSSRPKIHRKSVNRDRSSQ